MARAALLVAAVRASKEGDSVANVTARMRPEVGVIFEVDGVASEAVGVALAAPEAEESSSSRSSTPEFSSCKVTTTPF